MKDTFYFPHDYNCRSDVKIKKLLRAHGTNGYGIYWILVEDLYNNSNVLPLDYDGIAYELRCDIEVIKSIINDFELFVNDGDTFGSSSIENRLEERNEKSRKARENVNKRWAKQNNHTNVLPKEYEGNTIKERKEKEIKGNERKETSDDTFQSTDVGSSFEELIEIYPKTNSHKVETVNLFNNLSFDEKKKCVTFANHLQKIWKQNGVQDKYQFIKSCHTFVELKMFNGKATDIFPREISTEVKELKFAHEDNETIEKIKAYQLKLENKRKKYEETNQYQ